MQDLILSLAMIAFFAFGYLAIVHFGKKYDENPILPEEERPEEQPESEGEDGGKRPPHIV
ncbi:MAG: hypothetical protein ILP10_00530 [Lachnospiraceae bacterium]|nr:hypothetical protein [Lachnospiraceae bacterium]